MNPFKVGDKIVVVTSFEGRWDGMAGKVKEVKGGNCRVTLDGMNYSKVFAWHKLSKVGPLKCIRDKPSDKSYSFGVTSLTAIDSEGIHNDLSYSNPVALVELNGSHFVVIHESVRMKMLFCKGGSKFEIAFYGLCDYLVMPNLYPIELSNVSKLVALVKEVKAAPYEKEFQKSGTVKVTYLTV